MAEQSLKITVTAEDRASGPIKNVQSSLGGLERGTSRVSGAMQSLGHAAEVAIGTMATAITTYGISAVQNLNREMVKLSLEQSKIQVQSANLLKNAGLESYSRRIEEVIGKHEEMTSLDSASIRKSFNSLIAQTKDYEKALMLLSAAEDLAASKGISLETAAGYIASALSGSAISLSNAGVELDSLKMKSMSAAQTMDYLAKQIEASFGGASEALRGSTAGIFANYENQVRNLKRLFGEELTSSIAPVLEGIAEKISTMINSGQLEPLVDSFGNLITHAISFGSELGGIIMKLTGVTSTEEGVTRLANAFDRVAYILGVIEDALSRISAIIKDLHLDKFIEIGLRASLGGNMALWDYAGQQVQYEKEGAYTPYEAARRGLWSSPGTVVPTPKAETAADALARLREGTRAETENQQSKKDNSLAVQNNTQNIVNSTELLKLYRDQTSKTGNEIDTLGKTAGSAIGYMNSAMNSVRQMLAPSGGGGGGGCRTFRTGSYTTDGHNESYSSGGGPSGSPGMAWYNVLGNENASIVSAMGSNWASTISANSIVYNGCTGLVCTFDTVEKTTINGSAATVTTSYGNDSGHFVEIGKTVNDALITNKGDVIQFHPDDNILAFKDLSKLGGKNVSINNTFHIHGSGDPDRIAEEIMKKITRVSRIGF